MMTTRHNRQSLPAPPRWGRARGFSLIEVLVAVAVLGIGLLAVGGVQLSALQEARAGYQRTLASLAAQDAAERLWAAQVKTGENICPDNDDIAADWYENWQSHLPGLSRDPISDPDNCNYTIEVEWSGSSVPYRYEVGLPPL